MLHCLFSQADTFFFIFKFSHSIFSASKACDKVGSPLFLPPILGMVDFSFSPTFLSVLDDFLATVK